MARIALLCPDLLFGSKIEGALTIAGHSVSRFDSEERVRVGASFHDLLVVDLNEEKFDAPALIASMREHGELDAVPTLGFYGHLDQDTRQRAEEAGFNRVVPRSRMARETANLVEKLLPPNA